jgi:cell division protein FtsQ
MSRRRRRQSNKVLQQVWMVVQALSVLAAAVGGGVLAYEHFRQQQYLVVKNVQVVGNHRIPTEEILDYAQVPMGAPLYRAGTDAVHKSLMLHPDIHQASVRRVPPDTLVLEIVEHVPVATVTAAQGVYLVNTEARLFRRAQAGEDLDLPVITGVPPALFQDDQSGAQKLMAEATAVVVAWRDAGRDLNDLKELEMDADFGVTLRVGALPTEVALGRGNVADKLRRLRAVEAKLAGRSQQAARVFLDNARHPERVALLIHSEVPNEGGR